MKLITKYTSIIEIIKSPMSSRLAFFAFFIITLGLSFNIYSNNTGGGQSICTIKYNVISDIVGLPIGFPESRLNNFLGIIEGDDNIHFNMKLYHEKMTIVLTGPSEDYLRKFIVSKFPEYFNLESQVYTYYMNEYNNGDELAVSREVGLPRNINNIFGGIKCSEKKDKLNKIDIIILFIFISLFSSVFIYLLDCYVVRFLKSKSNVRR